MGNSLATAGDVFTCCRKHQNTEAVYQNNMKFGIGSDIDEAVLEATKIDINR
jgi:hypothetical protein